MSYEAAEKRYESMAYRPCGKSGLKLPLLSLGLWHNFGDTTPFERQREMVRTAFDVGITHQPARGGSLLREHLSEANLKRVRALDGIAQARGQSLAQMALAWVLGDPRVTSTLIGASTPEQIRENVGALANLRFSAEELAAIDLHAQESGVNLWEKPSTDQRP